MSQTSHSCHFYGLPVLSCLKLNILEDSGTEKQETGLANRLLNNTFKIHVSFKRNHSGVHSSLLGPALV